jgi:hypothetical protein
MKFAIALPADQTILYLGESGVETTVHAEALLFESLALAVTALAAHLQVGAGEIHAELKEPGTQDWWDAGMREQMRGREPHWVDLRWGSGERLDSSIEPVLDEEEFKAREDTW